MKAQPASDASSADSGWSLILFVAGDEPNSRSARANLAELCRLEELSGCCEVQVVDVLVDFEAAARHNVLVTPTLLVARPGPGARVIGNLSERRKVLEALGLESAVR